jgi:ubiquinone/menaquinone biosynthesis C-methylase UbiE
MYEDVLWRVALPGCVWLDLGCGRQLLPAWRKRDEQRLVARARRFIGLDYDHPSLKDNATSVVKIRGDVSTLPLADSSIDLVTSNMVFEHLDRPGAQLREVFRVLKPGGVLVFHTPNVLGYATILARLVPEILKKPLIRVLEGRRAEDVFPAYYRINSPRDIRHFADRTGFTVVELRLIVSGGGLVMCPPVVPLELLLIRLLMTRPLKALRTNIIAILRKPCLDV